VCCSWLCAFYLFRRRIATAIATLNCYYLLLIRPALRLFRSGINIGDSFKWKRRVDNKRHTNGYQRDSPRKQMGLKSLLLTQLLHFLHLLLFCPLGRGLLSWIAHYDFRHMWV
jgi:hypothetical protein